MLAGAVIAAVLVLLLHKAIKRVPWLFYLLAVGLDVVLLACSSIPLPSWFREYFLFLFQSNTLAMGLFTIVMFTGVLGDHSSLKRSLLMVRAELSIVASILCVGHIVMYGQSYLSQVMTSMGVMPAVRVLATFVALLLVLLLIPLAVTSLRFVHAKMSSRHWRTVQRLAYPFYGLIFIHILFYLVPPAMAGSFAAILSVVLYIILGIVYVILRMRQYSYFVVGQKAKGRAGNGQAEERV